MGAIESVNQIIMGSNARIVCATRANVNWNWALIAGLKAGVDWLDDTI